MLVAIETIELINQIMLVTLGPTVIWFLAQKKPWMRWGYILGLCSEPFWLGTSIINRQWGLFILTIVYTVCYCIGVYNYWIKKEKK